MAQAMEPCLVAVGFISRTLWGQPVVRRRTPQQIRRRKAEVMMTRTKAERDPQVALDRQVTRLVAQTARCVACLVVADRRQ